MHYIKSNFDKFLYAVKEIVSHQKEKGDMGEEKWGHYTEIVQYLNNLAGDSETGKNISKSITDDNDKAGPAKEIEQLSNKRKI